MWLLDALLTGFRTPTHAWVVELCRIIFGIACLSKFTVAFTHGQWNRLESDTFQAYLLRRQFGKRGELLLRRVYRPVLVARLIAALTLTVGVVPRCSCLVVAIGLALELTYAYRYNTIFMAMVALILSTSPGLGFGLTISSSKNSTQTWTLFLLGLLMLNVYFNSAWQKVRSDHFMSGLLLAQFVTFVTSVRPRLRHKEFFYPKFFTRRLANLSVASLRSWRRLSHSVVVLEVAVPLLLLFPDTRMAAAVVGVVMHLGFTFLLPRQLLGFSIASVSTYPVFWAA